MVSSKEESILDFLERFYQEKGYPPTVRDIQRGCGLSSTSVVEYHLRALERKGRLRRDREVSRGIRLAARPRTARLPLLGVIAAGQPIPVPGPDAWQSQALETLEVPLEMMGGEETYALRVKGTSMVDAFINDGDIVLLRHQTTARDGEMVAVWLKGRGEVTLKKLYRQGKKLRLQPANSQLEPLLVDPQDVEIQGKVLGVLRRFE